MKKIIVSIFLLFSTQSFGAALIDVNYFYLTDSMTNSGTYSSKKSMYNFAVSFGLSKKYFIGWDIAGTTLSDSISGSSVTQSFSAADMGPCFRWNMDSKNVYSLNFAYLLSSTMSFTDSGTSETWKSAPMLIRLNMEPEISDSIHLGLALNYYSATVSQKTVSNTVSSVSYSRTLIFPSLSMAFYF